MNKDTVNKIIDHFKKTYSINKVTLLDKPVAFSYMSETKDNITIDNVKHETAWSFCDDDKSSIRLYIYNQNKPNLVIDKKLFLNYMLNDNEDRKTVTDMFYKTGVNSISLDDILKNTDSLPKYIIVNSDEIIDALDLDIPCLDIFDMHNIDKYNVVWKDKA